MNAIFRYAGSLGITAFLFCAVEADAETREIRGLTFVAEGDAAGCGETGEGGGGGHGRGSCELEVLSCELEVVSWWLGELVEDQARKSRMAKRFSRRRPRSSGSWRA